MNYEEWMDLNGKGWKIEEDHRGLKQCWLGEKCQAGNKEVQMGHIFLSIQVFMMFEC